MRSRLSRLARMDRAELAWRAAAAARIAADRLRTRIVAPAWDRGDLRGRLAPLPELSAVRDALADRRWDDAQRGLAAHFTTAPQRFVVGPRARTAIVDRIRAAFPQSVAHAAARADRIVAGEYDLLGYRGLRYSPPASATSRIQPSATRRTASDAPGPSGLPDLDWHWDPVLNRRMPFAFWANVPFLDPTSGDHKVIWEVNRHQHWLALGRAFWLTGERKYRDRCLAELRSWLDANPPLMGANWASMLELAFRSISWLWAIGFFAEANADDSPWLVDLLVALDRQLTHIEHNLSYYFSPNTHILGEALALYVAGSALPELADSERRVALGRRILLEELERQVGTDGGHCERSTHYHRYVLDFYLLASIVARHTGDGAAAVFDKAVASLATAARLLADDRGRTPHFGDDDGGVMLPIAGRPVDDLRDSLAVAAAIVRRPDLQIGRAPEEAYWLLSALPATRLDAGLSTVARVRSAALADTGYYVSRSAVGDHLVIDGGPHGFQNGGHAHADALSLTLTVRGLPLLIDPGAGCYTADPALRDRMRSTMLHNTLTLDDRPQSVPRGPFHWSHVAVTRMHRWRANDGFDYFDGAHDGYAPVVHRRRVLVVHGDLVIVADLADGDGTHHAALHWHVDPRWSVDARGCHVGFTRTGERVGLTVPHGLVEAISGDPVTGLGWYSPAYGRVDRTTTVRVSHSGTAPFWMMSVFDLNPQNPVAAVDMVPVWAEAGAIAQASAIRITRTASIDYALFADPVGGRRATHGGPTWRVGEIETDARMLFCRVTADRPISRVALVDGSLVRTAGRRGFHLALPRLVADLHVDMATDARMAGPIDGARLVVGEREYPVAPDRRAAPRM
ncbi:MAG TPA: alginate lyase family protein [Vicinamibacterales bacterium]|nr:alginate lyase family protein [Vicinamibacterales bacterium]